MSKTPSAILSDALTALNRAATLAFTTAQDQARRDVTQATNDAREARRERDDAVNALHASRLEEQAWKQEAGVWKAAANQAELTINHHLETIAQIRQEATQWKNQCLRLEDTSRQEAVSWKEQFLRVEQERSKLAQRVEELVAEQLSPGGHAQASLPYTPMLRYSAMGNLSASTRLPRASALDSLSPSLQQDPPSKSAPSTSKPTSSINRTRTGPVSQLPTPISENQRSARQRATQVTVLPVARSGSTSNNTRQVLLRRVQAVVEVPVKEESADRGSIEPDEQTSISASNIASTSASSTSISKTPNVLVRTEPSQAATRVKRRSAAKQFYVEIDDESDGDDANQDSKQGDAEEYRPASDDDDDELLMGIETNRKEVYGMKRVPKPNSDQRAARPPTGVKKRKALPSLPPSTKRSRPSTVSKP